MDAVRVVKDQQNELPVPDTWRPTIVSIVHALRSGGGLEALPSVRPISTEDRQWMLENVQDYGATLAELPPDAWRSSVCQWMDGYWEVLVDLFTVEEGASDLVLFVRVYEQGDGYSFEVTSLHVP